MQPRAAARRLLAVVLVGIVAAACGSAADGDAETTIEPVPESSDDEGAPQQTLGADAALAQAFDSLGEARGYRATTSSAQTMIVEAFGLETVQELDADRPVAVARVASNGDSHVVLDLGPTFSAMVADPAVAAQLDTVVVELWTVGDLLVIDARGYQPIADLNPGFPLGPFAPGIGSVDLDRLRDISGDEVARALVGQSAIDPVELARVLPPALGDVEVDADDPAVFRAEALYGAVLEAGGTPAEDLARGLAAGLTAAFDVEASVLTDFYADLYRNAEAEIEFRVAEDGHVETMAVTTDLSGVWPAMFDDDDPLGLGGSVADRAATLDAVEDAVFVVESFTTFEIDDSISVVLPAGEYEDRTQLAAEFFAGRSG